MLYPQTILLVEDHDVVRIGTTMMLREIIPDVKILQSNHFEEAKTITGQEKPDLIILDINIPGGGSTMMVGILKAQSPATRILIFSGYEEHIFGNEYIRAGAHGYLNKNVSAKVFRIALGKVMDKGHLPDTEYNATRVRIVAGLNIDPPNLVSLLSTRELDVARLLIRGAATTTIAHTLGLQQSTISTYKMRIYEKLKVDNVIDLAAVMNRYQDGKH